MKKRTALIALPIAALSLVLAGCVTETDADVANENLIIASIAERVWGKSA